MRRVASFVLLTLSLMTLGSAASAAEPTKSKFYDFGVQVVNGTAPKPSIENLRGREQAVFARMMSLRKDMTPGIFKATKDPVFK